MRVFPLGDSAVVIAISETVDADTAVRVRAVAAEIERRRLPCVVDVVPAFGSVAVFFDPAHAASFDALRTELEAVAGPVEAALPSAKTRTVEIPVCYGGEH